MILGFRVTAVLAFALLSAASCGRTKTTSSTPNNGGSGEHLQEGLLGQIDVSNYVGIALKVQASHPYYQNALYGLKKDGSYQQLDLPNVIVGIEKVCQSEKLIIVNNENAYSQGGARFLLIVKSDGKVYGVATPIYNICNGSGGNIANTPSADLLSWKSSGGSEIVKVDISSGVPVSKLEKLDPAAFSYASNSSGDIIYYSSKVTYGDGRVQAPAISIREANGRTYQLDTLAKDSQPNCFFSGLDQFKNDFYYMYDGKFYIVRKSGTNYTKTLSKASVPIGLQCWKNFRTNKAIFFPTTTLMGDLNAIFKFTLLSDGDLNIASFPFVDASYFEQIVGNDDWIYVVAKKLDVGSSILKFNLQDGSYSTILSYDKGAGKEIQDLSLLPSNWLSFLQYDSASRTYTHKMIAEGKAVVVEPDVVLPEIGQLVAWEIPGCKQGYSRKNYICSPFMCEPNAFLGTVSCVGDVANSSAATKPKSCSADGQSFNFGTCTVTACSPGYSVLANACSTGVTLTKAIFALYSIDSAVAALTVNAGSTTKIAIGRQIEYLYGGTTYAQGFTGSSGYPNIYGSHTDYNWSVTGGTLNRTGLFDGYSYNYVAPALPGTYKLKVVLTTSWLINSNNTDITNAVRDAAGTQFTKEFVINVQ
jgi:hypothetical protein